MWAKPQRHKPYGLLKQLPISEHPWNSISMNFIEILPTSDGSDSILVIVDRLTKQGIFIPTTIHCTSKDLATLFILHIFSKHGMPEHVTSDHSPEFVSCFFRSLGKALDMTLHFTSGYHLKVTVKPNALIKLSSNTFVFSAIINKTIGVHFFPWPNLLTTMLPVQLLVPLHSLPTKVTIPIWPFIQNGILHHPVQRT